MDGIDLDNEDLLVIEVEVSLDSGGLPEVIKKMSNSGFSLAKIRTHGDQKYNPRNWLRGKIHGLMRKTKFANYATIGSEDSWSKPSTLLTQVEFVFIRNVDPFSEDKLLKSICEIYGLSHGKSPNTRLQCGNRFC